MVGLVVDMVAMVADGAMVEAMEAVKLIFKYTWDSSNKKRQLSSFTNKFQLNEQIVVCFNFIALTFLWI